MIVVTLLSCAEYVTDPNRRIENSTVPQIAASVTLRNGTQMGVPCALSMVGQSVYLGAERGVFRSTDDGWSWNYLGFDAVIHAVAEDRNGVVYAADRWTLWIVDEVGTEPRHVNHRVWKMVSNRFGDVIFGGSGISRTTDAGRTWINLGLADTSISLLETSPWGDLYAFVNQLGLYRSTDDGQTWVPSGLSGVNVDDLSAGLQHELVAVAPYDALYRSTDAGLTWMREPNIISVENALKVQYLTNGSIAMATGWSFAGHVAFGLYQSDNHGKSWTLLRSGQQVNDILETSGGTILLATEFPKTVYRAESIHGQFLETAMWIEDPRNMSAILDAGSNVLLAGCNSGLVRSRNQGGQWERVRAESRIGDFAKALRGDSVVIMATTNDGRLLESYDEGLTWSETYQPEALISSIRARNTNVMLGLSNGVIMHSLDGGISWRRIAVDADGLDAYVISAILQWDDGRIILGTASARGIFMSVDDGLTWTTTGRFPWNVTNIISLPNGKVLAGLEYAGAATQSVRFMVSEDRGETWSEVPTNWPTASLHFLQLLADHNVILAGSDDLFVSGYEFLQWGRIPVHGDALSISPGGSDTLFVGSTEGCLTVVAEP